MTSTAIKGVIDCDRVQSPTQPISKRDLRELTSLQSLDRRESPPLMSIPETEIINPRWVYLSAAVAGFSILMFHICDMNFCDPDIWHEMSLFRQSLIEGHVPTEDRFAYTPTVSPSIHHEWGSGAIFYAVAMTSGQWGIMTLKYGLVAGVLGASYWCARQRGASAAVFLTVAPAIAIFSSYGFTTIRAQAFTLQLLAVMLCCLELDKKGHRWWIAVWLPLHILWLNVHAGFVVGSGLMALHACEQIVRRRPFWHFVPVGVALAALIFVNPYGVQYLPYLMHGLTMARPLIVEWRPLWQHDFRIFGLYLLSLLPIAIALRQLGLRRMAGLVLLAAAAFAAAKHTRHLSLYCVVWMCYVPGYLQQIGIGARIDQAFYRYGRLVTMISLAIVGLCLYRVIPAAPWNLNIPSTNADIDNGLVCYPVGAIQYLDQAEFRGNIMLPFEIGGYTMWKLFPKAKVSLDGRYEVAYQPGVLEEHVDFFQAKPGWQDLLTKYPTDALVVPCQAAVSKEMCTMGEWTQVYGDGVYDIYTRPGFQLPTVSFDPIQVKATLP